MTASLSRLVPRRNADKAMPMRTSSHIRSDIAASEQEAQDAIAEGLRLNGQTKAILLSGDDEAHERHEADMARLRRIVARCEARQEDLSAELQAAEVREAEEAKDDLKAQAESAVAAVVAKAAEHYTAPAQTIAAFLAEWNEASRLAREARIPGPDTIHRRLAGTRTPDKTETYEAYVDEQGHATLNLHPYKPNGMIDRTKVRAKTTFTRSVPGTVTVARSLPSLANLVNLPRYSEAGDHHSGERVAPNMWTR